MSNSPKEFICPKCNSPAVWRVTGPDGREARYVNIFSQQMMFSSEWEHRCRSCGKTWFTKEPEGGTSN
jgi:predicted RNA-binding Zn-ribbon protein involved in translation (DUF1610 family)